MAKSVPENTEYWTKKKEVPEKGKKTVNCDRIIVSLKLVLV